MRILNRKQLRKMIRSVVIDSREPEWIQNLEWFGAQKTVSCMDAGDLLAVCEDGAGLLIERKTPTDFLGSMLSQRLLIQSALKLAPYRAMGFWPYVMITGDFYITNHGKTSYYREGRLIETQVSFDSVWGELLSIQELGVFVTFAKSNKEYPDAVRRLSDRNRGDLKTVPPAKRQGKALGIEASILSSLPMIGPNRALKICEQYTPIEFIIRLSRDEKPCGICGKIRQRILESLGIGLNEKIEMSIRDEIKEETGRAGNGL